MPAQVPLVLEPGERISNIFLQKIDKTVDLKIDLQLLLEVFPY
jgi:hypothetical protein